MKRKDGYYFVKYDGQWQIAELDRVYGRDRWLLTGVADWKHESNFSEIRERILMPDEKEDKP